MTVTVVTVLESLSIEIVYSLQFIVFFMEIILKRIARKDAYTIGHLYILKDGEVTRKVNCAMMNPHL